MILRQSPAKVNLCLRVLRRRPDGYHDIASLMQRISLYDKMIFQPVGQGITLHCPGSSLPENEDNIVYRAAASFFKGLPQATGGIDIILKKAIPLAAGLGGGSSNAATTLTALNEIFGFPYSLEDLMALGGRLGADVPFFIFGQTAWAFGIGDRLQAAENIPSFHLILINPRFELSTKMIYQSLNLRLTNEIIHYSIPRFCTVHDLAQGLFNDLELVSIKLHPVLADLKQCLMDSGAAGALMSGSGPTVFGVFAGEKEAIAAEKTLSGRQDWSVFRAASV